MSNIKLSPIFLRELVKSVAVGMTKTLAVSKANTMIALALEHQSGSGSEALTFRDSSQLPVSKDESEKLSSSDRPSEPTSCCPAPRCDGPAAHGSMGEFAAESSRQLRSSKDGLAYAAILAGHASPQQPNGPYKPPGKDSDLSEPAATSRMSFRDMSGPLWHA
jgi:hypothetical protein